LAVNKDEKSEKIRLQKCVELADVRHNENILDLGCGKDKPLKSFLGNNVNYIGIDKILGDDLEKGLPLRVHQSKFDVIFMDEFIEHIENFKTLLMKCRDVLSEDGRIIISTPSNNRILYGDFFNGIGEDITHIHCFRKTNMRNLARLCGLKIVAIKGTYVRFPPLLHRYVLLRTNQTIYTEVIVYKLVSRGEMLG